MLRPDHPQRSSIMPPPSPTSTTATSRQRHSSSHPSPSSYRRGSRSSSSEAVLDLAGAGDGSALLPHATADAFGSQATLASLPSLTLPALSPGPCGAAPSPCLHRRARDGRVVALTLALPPCVAEPRLRLLWLLLALAMASSAGGFLLGIRAALRQQLPGAAGEGWEARKEGAWPAWQRAVRAAQGGLALAGRGGRGKAGNGHGAEEGELGAASLEVQKSGGGGGQTTTFSAASDAGMAAEPLERPQPPTALPAGPLSLFYQSDGLCVDLPRWRDDWLCAAAQARFLRRSLVFAHRICLPRRHSRSGRDEWRPLALYFDLEHAGSRLPSLSKEAAEAALHCPLDSAAPQQCLLSVAEVGPAEPLARLAEEPLRSREVLLRRQGPLPEEGHLLLCQDPSLLRHLDSALLRPAPALRRVAWLIAAAMAWDFDAVQVARGPRIGSKKWPNLDRDTQPAALLEKLPQFIRPGRTLFIASDERTPGFFAALSQRYNVRLLSDFSRLWFPGSEFQVLSRRAVRSQEPIAFDHFMESLVDEEVLRSARTKVLTFPDLTGDPAEGLGEQGQQEG